MECWRDASGYEMEEEEEEEEEEEKAWLPPGFRFRPTDEELLSFYLRNKVNNAYFADPAIAEVDFNKVEPWDLPGRAKIGEKEWYFFSLRDRKYPTGMRTNRATGAGYWKATGKDREITCSHTSRLLGMKKTLVFYKGRAPKGEKTNWVIHEYRLEGSDVRYFQPPKMCKEDWVVCRVFKKTVSTVLKRKMSSEIEWHSCYEVDTSVPALESPQMRLLSSSSPQQETPLFHHRGFNRSNGNIEALNTDNIAIGSSLTYVHLPTSSFSIASTPTPFCFLEHQMAAGFKKPHYPLSLIGPSASSNELGLTNQHQNISHPPVDCNIENLYESCIDSESIVAQSNMFAHNTSNIQNPETEATKPMSYNEAVVVPLVLIPTHTCKSHGILQENDSLWAF